MALANIPLERLSSIGPVEPSGYQELTWKDNTVDRIAKESSKKNLEPPNPENYIESYLNKQDESFTGFDTLDSVLDAYSFYMRVIKNKIDTKIELGKDGLQTAKNAYFTRSLGCKAFKECISGLLDSESVKAEFERHLNLITEIMTVIDINSFEKRKKDYGSPESRFSKSLVLNNFVDMAVLEPARADRLLELVRDICPNTLEYQNAYHRFVEGAKAEIISIYSVLSSKVILEGGYKVCLPNKMEDVAMGMDVKILDKEGNLALFLDVKKAENLSSSLVCSVEPLKGGGTIVTRSGFAEDYLREQLDINDTSVKRLNVPEIIVRVPSDFNVYDEDAGMDIFNDTEYNAFRLCIVSEVDAALRKRETEFREEVKR